MKTDLLFKIAQKGYVIAFGANLNFATYDIVKKWPNIIAFLSIIVGILGLICQAFSSIPVSVCILILGIASIYIERFTPNIECYCKRGIDNTEQLSKLKNLYYEVKDMDENADFNDIETRYNAIEHEFNTTSQPNQILFSKWFAHFKLFCEKDISWMDEQLHFKLWKDKIPKSAHIVIYIIILGIIVYYCVKTPMLNEFFCKIMYIN